MKFELSLYFILVFLVPGCIALLAGTVWSSQIANLTTTLMTAPSNSAGALVLALAFAGGAVVDSLRTVLIDWLAGIFAKHKLPNDYLKKLNKRTLAGYELILQRTYEYYRFNANAFLSTFALLLSLTIRSPQWSLVFLGALAAALLYASVSSKSASNWALTQLMD